jgi:hypothetical protein
MDTASWRGIGHEASGMRVSRHTIFYDLSIARLIRKEYAMRIFFTAAALAFTSLTVVGQATIRNIEGLEELSLKSVVPPETKAAHERVAAKMKVDPRYQALAPKIQEAAKTRDGKKRAELLSKYSAEMKALADEAAKAEGVNFKRLAPIVFPEKPKTTPISAGAARALLNPTVKLTGFSSPWKASKSCPDGTVDFDGNKTAVYATSAPNTNDCDAIKAGKSAPLDVPPGMTKMTFGLKAFVDIKADAIGHLGPVAIGSFGIRANYTKSDGKETAVECTIAYANATNLEAVQTYEHAQIVDSVEPGEATCELAIPDGIQQFRVLPFVRVQVGADLLDIAVADADITPEWIAVNFSK